MREYRFVQLLIALLLMLTTSPFLIYAEAGDWQIARIAISLLFAILVISAVVALAEDRRTLRYLGGMALVALFSQILSAAFNDHRVLIVATFFGFVFLAGVLVLLVRHLFVANSVSVDTICASACAYILLGISWSFIYSIIQLFDADAFSLSVATGQGESLRFGAEQSANSLYFSFVTLTTLGYGDITPLSLPARMLTTVEALMGQFYLAILVARIVGIYATTHNLQKT